MEEKLILKHAGSTIVELDLRVAPLVELVVSSRPLAREGAAILPLETARKDRVTRGKRSGAPKVKIEEHTGRQLKSLYDDVLSQPIPDRFHELLLKLEARNSGSDEGSGK